jgi:hypothetical protein
MYVQRPGCRETVAARAAQDRVHCKVPAWKQFHILQGSPDSTHTMEQPPRLVELALGDAMDASAGYSGFVLSTAVKCPVMKHRRVPHAMMMPSPYMFLEETRGVFGSLGSTRRDPRPRDWPIATSKLTHLLSSPHPTSDPDVDSTAPPADLESLPLHRVYATCMSIIVESF